MELSKSQAECDAQFYQHCGVLGGWILGLALVLFAAWQAARWAFRPAPVNAPESTW